MNTKRVLLSAVLIIFALTILAASGSTRVGTINFGETTDVSLGRAGVIFTGSQYDGTVKLTRVNRGNLPGTNTPKFTQHLLNTRLYDADGAKVTNVIGPVYVYFKVRGAETKMWNDGELTIYYYNGATNKWVACPTTYIFKSGESRVSCRIRSMGLFGVGEK
jgi:hypothetical protein